ncbi:MAG: hypothetical protein KO202_06895 [Methanobacteriaceae archaeon]|jgi:hypothetical protein|nr:hypothetical protein [Methanobacteriaceae archaeon]
MKTIFNDSKGHVFTGISVILIISFIIIVILFLNLNYFITEETNQIIASDNLKYIVEDYNKNIEVLSYTSLKEISENVIKSKTPLKDSSEEFKKVLNEKLSNKNKEYLKKYDIKIESNVISIENSESPEYLKFKTIITVEKDNEKYNNVLESKTSVLNLKDPLGILLCSPDPSLSYNETNILFGNSLSKYLEKRNVENHENYINATAPLILKKCPYDPYIHHGDNHTLADCIKNSYYHESADGSCYLCRLEGKPLCPHYGFETFIIPRANIENNLSSVSSPDHVVFADNYPGDPYYYFNDSNKIIFLDSSHKKKYGL